MKTGQIGEQEQKVQSLDLEYTEHCVETNCQ